VHGEWIDELRPRSCESVNRLREVANCEKPGPVSSVEQLENVYLEICCVLKFVDQE